MLLSGSSSSDRIFPKPRNRVSVVNIKVNCESEKETRFLSPLPKPRNRVSVVNIKVNCESEKETRFLRSPHLCTPAPYTPAPCTPASLVPKYKKTNQKAGWSNRIFVVVV
jgi:hypothetical protein